MVKISHYVRNDNWGEFEMTGYKPRIEKREVKRLENSDWLLVISRSLLIHSSVGSVISVVI
jgi:hypothetical protein